MPMTITGATLTSWTGSTKYGEGRSYDQEYNVTFTGDYDAATLRGAGGTFGLPSVGSTPTWDTSVFVDEVSVGIVDGARTDADNPLSLATYSVRFASKRFDGMDLHPLDRPPQVRGSGGNGITEVNPKDTDGDYKVNSSGQLYSGIRETPVRGLTLTVTRNEGANPLTNAWNFSNTTNSATWYGVPIEHALMGQIEWTKEQEEYAGSTVTYYTVTYPITLKRDGWRWKPLDAGTRLSGGEEIVDDSGNGVSEPVFLDGSGGRLAAGSDPVVFPAAGYPDFEKASWGTLNLPNPFA